MLNKMLSWGECGCVINSPIFNMSYMQIYFSKCIVVVCAIEDNVGSTAESAALDSKIPTYTHHGSSVTDGRLSPPYLCVKPVPSKVISWREGDTNTKNFYRYGVQRGVQL